VREFGVANGFALQPRRWRSARRPRPRSISEKSEVAAVAPRGFFQGTAVRPMARDDRNSSAGPVIAITGGALLLWLLFRGGGGGAGLGGSGDGSGARPSLPPPPPQPQPPPQPPPLARARIRLTSKGITVNGVPMGMETAVAIASTATRTELVITGDARQGTADDLRRALGNAGVRYFEQGLH